MQFQLFSSDHLIWQRDVHTERQVDRHLDGIRNTDTYRTKDDDVKKKCVREITKECRVWRRTEIKVGLRDENEGWRFGDDVRMRTKVTGNK